MNTPSNGVFRVCVASMVISGFSGSDLLSTDLCVRKKLGFIYPKDPWEEICVFTNSP